jgi:hypothetical protein
MRIPITKLLLFFTGYVAGQTPVGTAPVPKVEKDGFYRIRLSPGIVSYLTPGFANVRVTDDNGFETPYLLDEESPVFSTTSFRDYKMDKNVRAGCCTELLFHNPDKVPINNISLQIRNAQTYKDADLLGSDDRSQWYALRAAFTIYPVDNQQETAEVRIMDFPLSNYGFYKLVIDDSTTAPLNIMKAGYYETSTEQGRYSEVPEVKLQSEEKSIEKETWVTLTMDTTALIDKLVLQVSGPAFYHRQAEVYARRWYPDRRGKMIESMDYLEGFAITSGQEPSLRLGSVRAKELVVKISNQDNQPLVVSGAQLFQLNRYLVVWLAAAKNYTITVGEERQAAPDYDLGFFRDSIPAEPVQLSTGDLLLSETALEASTTIFTNRNIIWVAILLVIVLLGYMSRKLIKEASAKSK